ncbi:hypothetical protein NMG60_11013546 [Bertholletia excelsa]
MGRRPCCAKEGLNKGAWTAREDKILSNYISIHGEGKWRDLPARAGLKRCGKSCRLRWLNYLRPDIKRGNITEEEEDLIIRLHKLLGNRWSLIAGRLPGRTDNEIKNFWNTNLSKRVKGRKNKNNQKSKQKKSSGDNEAVGVDSSGELGLRNGAGVEPHKAIRTKAIRCTKVFVPRLLDHDLEEKISGAPNSTRGSSSFSFMADQENSSDFFLDFNINDLIISDMVNSELQREDGDGGGTGISAASSCGFPAALQDSSRDKLMLDGWEASDPVQGPEGLELGTLGSFLDSEDDWIK